MDIAAFINRWESSAAAERANYQLFLSELCDILDVPRPEPSVAGSVANHYVFERAVTIRHPNGDSTIGRIDLYKRGCFVLEAKQGSNAEPAATTLFDPPKRRGAGFESLWRTMDSGGFSPILREHVLQFNGGLFETVEALPLNAAQFERLCQAAKFEWKDVEPAIFGTLLERALDPGERHKLGARYTPRAYIRPSETPRP